MIRLTVLFMLFLMAGCGGEQPAETAESESAGQSGAARLEAPERTDPPAPELLIDRERLSIYHPVELKPDLSGLSGDQREMLRLMIDAAEIMDDLFWRQSYGDPAPLLESLDDEQVRAFVELNYGPWDRLNGNQPFWPATCKSRPARSSIPKT